MFQATQYFGISRQLNRSKRQYFIYVCSNSIAELVMTTAESALTPADKFQIFIMQNGSKRLFLRPGFWEQCLQILTSAGLPKNAIMLMIPFEKFT